METAALYVCVLITVERGMVLQVAQSVGEIEQVGLIQAVTGPFDIVALLRLANPSDIGKIVVTDIQGKPGVLKTLTLPIMRDSLEPMHWLLEGKWEEQNYFAYVLVTVEPHPNILSRVQSSFKEIRQVGLVESIAGPYDVFLLVRAESPSGFEDIVYGQVHGVSGLTSTLTLMAFENILRPRKWFLKDLTPTP
jgi:DNA-binding Lrp family transcriptional regulator